ncbi:hypothetical protein ABPG77_009894 [Micractinium sp. CCAP 211/92]
MSRSLLLLAVLGLCGLAAAQQTYSSLQPPAYTIELTFTINGVTGTPIPCNSSTCLPQVSVPDHDSITINYSGPAGAPGNTISLMSCYTNSSAANRAWRKANAVINKDKQCNTGEGTPGKPFATGLPTGTGSFKWTPGPNTPPSDYFIQLLEVVADSGSDPTYAAMGRSAGQYAIIPIDSTPGWLMALTGVFCAIGPLTLAGFFIVEKVIKKD